MLQLLLEECHEKEQCSEYRRTQGATDKSFGRRNLSRSGRLLVGRVEEIGRRSVKVCRVARFRVRSLMWMPGGAWWRICRIKRTLCFVCDPLCRGVVLSQGVGRLQKNVEYDDGQ